MLEIPTLELEERIRQEIEENPALEEGVGKSEDSDEQEILMMISWIQTILLILKSIWPTMISDYKLIANNSSRDDKHEDIPFFRRSYFS